MLIIMLLPVAAIARSATRGVANKINRIMRSLLRKRLATASEESPYNVGRCAVWWVKCTLTIIVMVLIIGAGPTGLVIAHELARYGVPCRLIDKILNRPVTSRAIAIVPRTLEVFDLMRIADDFLAAGRRIHAINMFS